MIWSVPPHNSRELVAEAQAAHDGILESASLAYQSAVLAFQGDTGAARAVADAAIEAAAELGGLVRGHRLRGVGYRGLGRRGCCDAAGRGRESRAAPECPARDGGVQRAIIAQAALAGGDLLAARRGADEAVTTATGFYLSKARR